MAKRDSYLDKNYLLEFQNHLIELDNAIETSNLYTDNVIQFIDWFQETEAFDFEVDKVTTIDVRDYRSFLQNVKQHKATTINSKLRSVKNYFSFLSYKGYIPQNPTEHIKSIKTMEQQEAKSFDDKTYRTIRREIYRSGNKLHICIWEILTKTGCRVSELCNLRFSDIQITERTARIRFVGKGNKVRELKLHLDAKKAILDYLKIRNKMDVDCDFLLISERKQQFCRSSIWRIVNKYSARCGCHITVHQCRHYVLRTLLKNGADINTVAALAGHSSPLITAKTYTLARQEEQDAALDTL